MGPAAEPAQEADLARARGGDDAAFTRLVEPLRGSCTSTWSMPPLAHRHHGLEAVTDVAVRSR
jgi:hypothetical protein